MKAKSLILALALCTAPKAHAQFINAESLVGNNAVTVDVKAGAPITEKIGIFTRHRLTENYDGENGYFGLTDLTYSLSKRVNVFVEGQFFSEASPEPKIGIDYNFSKGDFSFMAAGTFWRDATLQTIIGYRPKRLPIAMQLENFISGDRAGYAYSIQRARVGVQKGNWFLGVGADFNQAANTKSPHNLGFVAKYSR